MVSFVITYFIVIGIMFSVLACFDTFLVFIVPDEAGFIYLINGVMILVVHLAIALGFLISYSLMKAGVF